MSFASPTGVLVAAAALVLVPVIMMLAAHRRSRELARLGHGPALERMRVSLSPRRQTLKAALLALAIMAAVVAAARPTRPGEVLWQQRGIDLVVVMDYSASMLARDVYPDRLQRMTEEVEALLDALRSDRVGVIVFAGAAAHFPLTHDTQAARSLFRGLTVLDLPPGSDLGAGVRTARCVVRPGLGDDPGCPAREGGGTPPRAAAAVDPEQPEERARAIVIFTDGEDTEGRARAEIERAALLGIEVFLVGVGTPAGELVPELDARGTRIGWKKTPDGSAFVTTRLDVDGLTALATVAGGADRLLFAQPSEFVTDALMTRLGRLQRGVLDERAVARQRDVYHWLLFPAFMLLVIEACMSARRRTPVSKNLRA